MTKFKTLLLAAMGVAMAGSAIATTANAETYFQATHPARAEINHRLAVKNHRIRVLRREGVISPRHAAYLHHKVHMIRKAERIDARFDHGRVTPREDRALNQQANQVSREINR
jgi:hypothetical protein